ncbi:peptidylprolyl isomerase [Sandarakinorhabdus sp. DWP1-3-1]|uniref:peptidylprolyl isomerase n=1 Tax=Sandarakinorhabdus sp. DWP1-3-1 TaxID=2804627 RepID=UPI003CEFFA66
MTSLSRIACRLLLATGVLLGAASGAAAQGRPDPKEFKPPPVLPKMAAPTNIPGMVATVNDEDVLLLDLSTGGRVKIVMRPDVAPKHVERVRTLARQGFYDGTVFHRVIEGFMAQGGDPTGTGQGGSKLPDLVNEFNDLPHVRGAVSMARAQGLDSANSQFFIVFQPVLKLDRSYTVFGRVVAGMDFVDTIVRGEPPENPTRILKASIAADKVPPPAFTPIPTTALPTAPDAATPSLALPGLPPQRPAPPPQR